MNQAGRDQEAVLASMAQRKKLQAVREARERKAVERERRETAHLN